MNAFARPIALTSPHPNILLDSGAFSIWRSGAEVDFDAYLSYCETVKRYTLSCVNLDVIPGSHKKRASPEDIEDACKLSFRRWKALQKSGALIMPVFHQGDELSWLDVYLEQGAKYIGISPNDSFPARIRQKWVREAHEYMEHKGVKLNKEVFTHCLGVITPRALYDLPAWSADASATLRYVAIKRLIYPSHDHKGRVTGLEHIYVGSRPGITGLVDWDAIAEYLSSIPVKFGRDKVTGRIIIEDFVQLTAANLNYPRKIMQDTGVRAFIAGSVHRSALFWTIVMCTQWPYILRSYALIKESTGDTIKEIYNRALPDYIRRPDKDRKVETARGLFT